MRILAFLIGRGIEAGAAMLVLAAVCFAVAEGLGGHVPGAGAAAGAEPQATAAALLARFGGFLERAVAGDLGVAADGRPALAVVLGSVSATADLALAALVLAAAVSVPLGLLAAISPSGALSRLAGAVAAVLVSIPVFLAAILVGWAFEGGAVPVSGGGTGAAILWGWESGLATAEGRLHLVLPAASIAAVLAAAMVRRVRAGMAEAIRSSHVRGAEARGLPPARIRLAHAARSALPRILGRGGPEIGALLGLAILVETVFGRPGVGPLLVEAAARGDAPVLIAAILVLGLGVVLTTAILDILGRLVLPPAAHAGGAA